MRVLVFGVAVLALGGGAHAADKLPAVVQRVADCRPIADPGQRLACFDAAAAGLSEATAKKDIVVLDRQAVRETRRGLFGFHLPNLPFFGGDKDKTEAAIEQVDEIDTVVKRASSAGYNLYRMVMEDDAVWVTSEGTPFGPHAGSKVHIKRAALGSYFIKIDNNRAVKGKREG